MINECHNETERNDNFVTTSNTTRMYTLISLEEDAKYMINIIAVNIYGASISEDLVITTKISGNTLTKIFVT